ncbi:MAG: hypothetical protein K5641_02400, partial [Lachnospiraceae bacterium]|nr:hypothetical protein [Lachnospiraceae bacterium]
MKKFLSVTLSVVMVAAMLAGCGNKEEAPAAAAPAQEAAAPAAAEAAPAADAAAPASDYKLEMKLSH